MTHHSTRRGYRFGEDAGRELRSVTSSFVRHRHAD